MQRNYLRYVAGGVRGLVGSSNGNVIWAGEGLIATPALESVHLWNVRKAAREQVMEGSNSEVTALARSPSQDQFAVGYEDGTIRLWSGSEFVVLSGHRAGVSVLKYDPTGAILISGGKDTDIIVWDVVNESGKFRLKGHKGIITDCNILPEHNLIISSSKDTFVKVWDAETQHCIATLLGHRNEVCGLVLCPLYQRIITSSVDNELRVWKYTFEETDKGVSASFKCELEGSVFRQSNERATSLVLSSDQRVLAVHGPEKNIEIYRIRNEAEIKKKLARRAKRIREKKAKSGDQSEDLEEKEEIEHKLEDDIVHSTIIHCSAKVRSIDVRRDAIHDSYQLVALLTNNTVETYAVAVDEKAITATSAHKITHGVHHTPIRSVALSSDDTMIATTSNNGALVWNRHTQQVIRTLEDVDYGLCSIFVPGNRHLLIGTKSGKLLMFDLGSGDILETIDAHAGAVWSLALQPDNRGFVSGGSDKEVKFWEFELLLTDEKKKRLTCVHTRTLRMTEEVLCVAFSPNQNLLAVALLDNTVKVFYSDTLKFLFPLYGHRLPVTSIDISADSTLIITGSADKNVKVWGLDFGDCHKSFFAHDDTITCVRFVSSTHFFFSVAKDGKIKYWDGDRFEQILTLEGHHGEISSCVVTKKGDQLVTVSHDRSVRFWDRSEEILNLDEEREMEREKDDEKAMLDEEAKIARAREHDEEAGRAGRKTTQTLVAAEQIMEALDLAVHEREKAPHEHPDPLLVALGNISAGENILRIVEKIRTSELDEALMVLPFSYVMRFLPYLDQWVQAGRIVERACHCILFLLRVHLTQITANKELVAVLASLREHTAARVSSVKDLVGYNIAALKYIQQELSSSGVTIFADISEKMDSARKKKRKITGKPLA